MTRFGPRRRSASSHRTSPTTIPRVELRTRYPTFSVVNGDDEEEEDEEVHQVPLHRLGLADHPSIGRHEDRRAVQVHPEVAIRLGLEEFGRLERRRVDLVSRVVVLLVAEREEDTAGLGGAPDIEVLQLKLVGRRRVHRAAYCCERKSGRERAGEDESRGDALHGEIVCCVDARVSQCTFTW